MADVLDKQEVLKGGEFLVANADYHSTFTPEDFNEEQLMVRQMVQDFIDQEITPNLKRIEKTELRAHHQIQRNVHSGELFSSPKLRNF